MRSANNFCGISRATYYRRKKILDDLGKAITPPSKRPKKINKPKWGEAEKQLVLRIRRENSTYGKDKLDFVKQASFPIQSIQVDGGSEFMADSRRGVC